jgi:hypothetical protein
MPVMTLTQDRLYSVTQSHAPYSEIILVGHKLDYPAAKALMDQLKDGVLSLVPSSDFADDVGVGDVVTL